MKKVNYIKKSKNGYIGNKKAYEDRVIAFTQQVTMDIIQIELSKEFDFTPDMLKKFHDKYIEYRNEYHGMLLAGIHENRDPSVVIDNTYGDSVVDRALKDAVGEENYVSRDERYAL